MNDRLFVYGTLLQGTQSAIASYLHGRSDFRGAGYLRGRLFDLGRYPGAVYEVDSRQKVFGHIFVMHEPEPVLEKLDAYEGVPNEYKRALVPIEIAGAPEHCWAYLYHRPVAGLVEITSGDYREYAKKNPDHQQFIDSV